MVAVCVLTWIFDTVRFEHVRHFRLRGIDDVGGLAVSDIVPDAIIFGANVVSAYAP